MPTAEWPVQVKDRFTARGTWSQGKPWVCDDLRWVIDHSPESLTKPSAGAGGGETMLVI